MTISTFKSNSPNKFLLAILALSLFFNLYGIKWGLPFHWHPDEKSTIVNIVIPMGTNLDLNPHSFLKPSFYYYFLQPILSPYYLYYKLFNPHLNIGYANFVTNVFFISRITTALIGTVSVFLLYLITSMVFNANTGLLASFFLAVSMGFSSHSHFAYMDIPMICLLLLMILLSIQYLKTGRLSKLYLAALIGGLSISTKYNAGLVVILIIIICHFDKMLFRKNIDIVNKIKYNFSKSLLISLLLVIVGFFLATPFAILDFPVFANDLLEQLFIAKGGYKGMSTSEWNGLPNLLHLSRALGAPLLILAFCGLLWIIGTFVRRPKKITAILLFPPIIYFLSISNMSISSLRYTLLLIPFMAFWAAAPTNCSLKNCRSLRLLIFSIVIFVSAYSCFYTFRGVHCFKFDTRKASEQWIRDHIPFGNEVEVYSPSVYLPDFPKGVNVKRIVFGVPPNLDYIKFRSELKKKALVRLILQFFGKSIKNIVDDANPRDRYDIGLFSVNSLVKRNPSTIVLTSLFYRRFLRKDRVIPYPELTYFFKTILSGEAGYKIVKIFENKTPTGEFVNPTITILKKIDKSNK